MTMKKSSYIAIVIIVVALAVAAGIVWSPALFRGVSTPAAPAAVGVQPTPIAAQEAVATAAHNDTTLLPHASETYRIMQSSSTLPKIIQATIDPLGVHVGDTQHLSVILNDPNQIVSVTAFIQTDHGTTTVALSSSGPAQVSEILPQKYYVDANNDIALVSNSGNGNGANGGAGNVALAAGGADVKYTGSWLVHDTHDTTYRTIFVAKDSAGNISSVTMAWSDACGIPNSPTSTVTPTFPCSITSLDGVEQANVSITGSMTLSSTFVYNPGYNIIFSGSGSLIINTGGGLWNGYLCALDADGDGYFANGNVATDTATSCPNHSGWEWRYDLKGSGDCDDTDSNVHPGQTAYFTTTSNGGTWDYNCDGTVTEEYPSLGSTGGCSNGQTCNGTNATGWDSTSVPSCGSSAFFYNQSTYLSCPQSHVSCPIMTYSTITQACN